jgi:hypothetical protein
LQTKVYTITVNVTSNPTYVDLSAQKFKNPPIINLTAVIDSPLRINNTFPSYSPITSNSTLSNITVYSNTGAFVPNTLVNLIATGY